MMKVLKWKCKWSITNIKVISKCLNLQFKGSLFTNCRTKAISYPIPGPNSQNQQLCDDKISRISNILSDLKADLLNQDNLERNPIRPKRQIDIGMAAIGGITALFLNCLLLFPPLSTLNTVPPFCTTLWAM